uniref:Serine/threonine specific protein phosphatases domain-containing protein n=1 Tax=Parascaris equorum TaxID=6256 RepID=A0A914S2W2_PAREQ
MVKGNIIVTVVITTQHPICSLISWSVSLHEFGNQKGRDDEISWVQSVSRSNISSSFPPRFQVRRPTLVPPYGLICDILWSDPDDKYSGWALSPRGISFTFSERVVKEFCEKHDIDLIIRGHQLTYDVHLVSSTFSLMQPDELP